MDTARQSGNQHGSGGKSGKCRKLQVLAQGVTYCVISDLQFSVLSVFSCFIFLGRDRTLFRRGIEQEGTEKTEFLSNLFKSGPQILRLFRFPYGLDKIGHGWYTRILAANGR